jgi:arylsulfatase A-like enzyme
MKQIIRTIMITAGMASVATVFAAKKPNIAAAASKQKPNILLIVADDMGFSDAGCYGGEISTPNLDRLAANGLRFTQAYSTARCTPTRTCLMTGYYFQKRAPSALVSELLGSAGYRCYHSGKWHVVEPGSDTEPMHRGFHHSYYNRSTGNHFSGSPSKNIVNTLDGSPAPETGDYYSSTVTADYTIRFLREHAEKYSDSPFFAYVAFLAPHFPLQAPQEDIDRYRDRYDEGWDVVREKRLAKLRREGILNCGLSALEEDLAPRYYSEYQPPLETSRAVPWNTLDADRQKFQADKMAIHAAMIDRMDREIGRILEQLRAMNAFDNTVIMFLSDNGADSSLYHRGRHDESAPMGSEKTYLCLGPGWSSAANTPFRRHKIWLHEGGISMPLIVHWPEGIAARGALRHTPCHVIDFVPTALELAGVTRPGEFNGKKLLPLDGKSLLQAFDADRQIERSYLYFEHAKNRALRMGDWKIVSSPEENDVWSLYNLAEDRSEIRDLAASEPERLKTMVDTWTRCTSEFRAIPRGKALKEKDNEGQESNKEK